MAPKSPADRVKATRLRHKTDQGVPLKADEAAWLEDYGTSPILEAEVNASASAERVVHIEERSAAAQGNHPHPDAYASIATAEGLRADTLLRIVTSSLIECNNQYRVMAHHLLARTTAIEDAHVAMLEAVRDNYLGRIEAEAQATMLANAGGEGSELGELLQLLSFVKQAKEARAGGKKKPAAKKQRKPLGAL